MARETIVSILAAGYAGLALFFLGRFAFHMLAATADRKDKSIRGIVDTRYSASNYTADTWQHLIKSHKNAAYFALMIGVPLVLKGVVWLLHSQGW